jgi:hypothetical protein
MRKDSTLRNKAKQADPVWTTEPLAKGSPVLLGIVLWEPVSSRVVDLAMQGL